MCNGRLALLSHFENDIVHMYITTCHLCIILGGSRAPAPIILPAPHMIDVMRCNHGIQAGLQPEHKNLSKSLVLGGKV